MRPPTMPYRTALLPDGLRVVGRSTAALLLPTMARSEPGSPAAMQPHGHPAHL